LTRDFEVTLEAGHDGAAVAELERRGHRVIRDAPMFGFGGAQIIVKLGDGYCAASDHRKDGQAVGF
jgi:gamma-glutamyltranspeptidase/glutathione hydrolase